MTTKEAWLYLASIYQDYGDGKIHNNQDRICTKEESLTINGLCYASDYLLHDKDITPYQEAAMKERIKQELTERKVTSYLADYNPAGALVRVECCKKFAAELTD